MKMLRQARERTVGALACCVLILAGGTVAAVSETIGHATSGTRESAVRNDSPVQRVVDALTSAGISVQPDQIEMLSGAIRLGPGASFRVVSAANVTAGTARVKLRCENNHGCLPFYVLVHRVSIVKARAVESDAITAALPGPTPNIVRGGDHAILILETPDSRMSFPVICLQSGSRGQRVRVTSPDHARFFEAQVVAAGLLKGDL